jgi:hypothetical protein
MAVALSEVCETRRMSSGVPVLRGRSCSKRGESRPLPPAEGGTGLASEGRRRWSPVYSSSDDISAAEPKSTSLARERECVRRENEGV